MRKVYTKPMIRKVKLIPSEAVLQSCKNPNSGGPDITGCEPDGPCSAFGS